VPFSISFLTNRTAQQGTYPVTIQLAYQDQYGSRFTKEVSLQIRIAQERAQPQQFRTVPEPLPSETVRLLFMAAFAIIVAVGLIVIMRARRKSTKEVL